jgi:cytochrome oxidase Cu insertion factor (SCO1/SenC/PrrC family)
MHKIFAAIPALALGAAISTLTLATVLTAQAPATPKAASSTPRKADEFVIHMPDHTDKLLSSYRGKVVVIAFMYTTCPHCQHTAGLLSHIQTDYAAKGVQVLGVTFDQTAQRDVAQFDKLYATGFPCGYSTVPQVQKFLHVADDFYVPMMAFIDRAGTVRLQIVSHGDPNDEADKFLGEQQEANVRQELDKLLKTSRAPATAKQAPKS